MADASRFAVRALVVVLSSQVIYALNAEAQIKEAGQSTIDWPTPDITISTEYGSFIIGHFQVQILNSLTEFGSLSATVTNNTNKTWLKAVFRMNIQDKSGKKISKYSSLAEDDFTLDAYRLEKGKTGTATMYGIESLLRALNNKKSPIGKIDFEFVGGTQQAEYVFLMTKPVESRELRFEDQLIDITFSISEQQISFALRNKTENPIKVNWDQTAYVDVSGDSHRVVHEGVRYLERDKPQVPTMVPPTARIRDIVFPSDYVYYEQGKDGGWRNKQLFPNPPEALLYKGHTFSVFLPMEINGSQKNYLFVFKIDRA